MAGVVDLIRGPRRAAAPTVVAPTPREPAPLPTESDAAILEARRRRRTALSRRQGRASTVLSDRREFTNDRLGQ